MRDGNSTVTTLGVIVDLRALPVWAEYVKWRDAYSNMQKRKPRRRRRQQIGRQFIDGQARLQQEFIDKVTEEAG